MNAKIHAVAKIVRESSVEFLATKHGVTVDAIVEAIEAGNMKICDQFAKLVVAGINETIALAASRKISLI